MATQNTTRRRPTSLRAALREGLIDLALFLLTVWMVMVWLGAAHHFDGRVPDFGFWTTFFVLFAVCTFAGYLRWDARRQR